MKFIVCVQWKGVLGIVEYSSLRVFYILCSCKNRWYCSEQKSFATYFLSHRCIQYISKATNIQSRLDFTISRNTRGKNLYTSLVFIRVLAYSIARKYKKGEIESIFFFFSQHEITEEEGGDLHWTSHQNVSNWICVLAFIQVDMKDQFGRESNMCHP